MNIQGKYQHYKNKKIYEVIGIALHSETKEEMVIYKALSPNEQLWVRPRNMFFEHILYEGNSVERFRRVDDKG